MVLVPSDYYKSLKGVESEWRKSTTTRRKSKVKKHTKKTPDNLRLVHVATKGRKGHILANSGRALRRAAQKDAKKAAKKAKKLGKALGMDVDGGSNSEAVVAAAAKAGANTSKMSM